jgi:hypothetical protein
MLSDRTRPVGIMVFSYHIGIGVESTFRKYNQDTQYSEKCTCSIQVGRLELWPNTAKAGYTIARHVKQCQTGSGGPVC